MSYIHVYQAAVACVYLYATYSVFLCWKEMEMSEKFSIWSFGGSQ